MSAAAKRNGWPGHKGPAARKAVKKRAPTAQGRQEAGTHTQGLKKRAPMRKAVKKRAPA